MSNSIEEETESRQPPADFDKLLSSGSRSPDGLVALPWHLLSPAETEFYLLYCRKSGRVWVYRVQKGHVQMIGRFAHSLLVRIRTLESEGPAESGSNGRFVNWHTHCNRDSYPTAIEDDPKEELNMKIEIKTKNVKNEPMVRGYIEKKVHFALDRTDARIDKVKVRLEDETKDSKRFDGSCRIEVEMRPRGHVHVSSSGDSAYDCVLQAVRKMEHAVKHDIDRHLRSAKIRHQKSKRTFIRSLPKLPIEQQATSENM